jgi:hypothetical protein
MTEVKIDGEVFRIEFRHITKLGKHRQLFDRAPIKAVTTCVIATDTFIAIDNAICANEDNFSRRQGRIRALDKVLKHCGALKKVSAALMSYYITSVDPPTPVTVIKPSLSEAERQTRIQAGEKVHNERLSKAG